MTSPLIHSYQHRSVHTNKDGILEIEFLGRIVKMKVGLEVVRKVEGIYEKEK